MFKFLFLILFPSFLFANDFQVIAKVDDKIITKYDLNNYEKILKIFFNNNNLSLEEDIINYIVDLIIKEKAIKNEKIKLDEDEFNFFLKNIENKEKIDLEIEKNNIDKEIYYNFLKINFLWEKLIQEKIRPTISITNSEINDSLEYLTDDSIRTRYNISQIVIYKNNNNSTPIVEKLYKEIKEKNNFESIAEKFSQDNRSNKGNIGWVDEKDLNEKIFEEIKNIQIGAISQPIYLGDEESGFYLIIKLNDKKEEMVAKKDDISRTQYYIYNQKLILAIKNYLEELYNNTFIEK